MPIPDGVITRTLQVDPSTNVLGASNGLEVQIIPNYDGADVKLIKWQPTNTYLISFFNVLRGGQNQGVVLPIPTVDQPGFVLTNSDEPITNWYYTVRVRYLLDGRKVGNSVTKTIAPTADTPPIIDFDELPTGNTPNVYQGPRGYSAYQIAVNEGFSGNVDEWLESLVGEPGAPGPQGPPGGTTVIGVQSYIHIQGVPAATWVINHPLSYVPNIVVTDSTGAEVEGDVRYTAPSQITVTFAGAFSGTAYLS